MIPLKPRQHIVHVTAGTSTVVVHSRMPVGLLASLQPDPGLAAFSDPSVAQSYLSRIAVNRTGVVTAAYPRGRRLLVGYAAVSVPDPEVRWGTARVPGMLELLGIELSPDWRRMGLIGHILDVTFNDPWYEDKIVVSSELSWHWDLKNTGLTKWKYRVFLRRTLSRAGFQEMMTDEPNVRWDPANIFMARVGSQAPEELRRRFDELLFTGP